MESTIYVMPSAKPDLTIDTPPTRTVYQVGDLFDPTGIVITGTDSKGQYYVLDSFSIISSPKPLTIDKTSQVLYVVVGEDIGKVTQAITVQGSGTYASVGVMAHSQCTEMFSEFYGEGSYLKGTEVSVLAVLKDEYRFVGWFDASGNCLSTDNPYKFILQDDIVCYAKAEEKVVPPTPTETEYLCFTAAEDGVRISLTTTYHQGYVHQLEWSMDKETWTNWTWDQVDTTVTFDEKILLNNEKFYVRAKSVDMTKMAGYSFGRFVTQGHYYCSGSIMSLLDPEVELVTIPTANCFDSLFNGCDGIFTAPKLSATTLAEHCYESMFNDCYNMTSVPTLPATEVPAYVYKEMFKGCVKITTTPELPAVVLNEGCYYGMFQNCTKLTTIKNLVATILQPNCYSYMFSGCTSLVSAPYIKATTLASNCCQSMFEGCTSLTSSPELYAVEDAISCYMNMFNGCSILQTVNSIYTKPEKTDSFKQMFKGCSIMDNITVKFMTYNSDLDTNWITTTIDVGSFKCYRELPQSTTYKLPPTNNWVVTYLN